MLIYYDIFSEYTPIELILLEILLCTLICTFVGVLMFLFSLYINKIIAVAGGLALAQPVLILPECFGRKRLDE